MGGRIVTSGGWGELGKTWRRCYRGDGDDIYKYTEGEVLAENTNKGFQEFLPEGLLVQ